MLWLIGYAPGIALFPLVPTAMIGWYIMPVGLLVTVFVLWKWVRVEALSRAILLGFIWFMIAIVFDYAFIVKMLNPADGYYKPDVYLYYASTFLLPVTAALLRQRRT